MIKAINNFIILEKIEKEESTKSGIIVTTDSSHKRDTAVIFDKGSKCTLDVELGSEVMFSKYAPEEINYDGKTYLIISEEDIIAVIE